MLKIINHHSLYFLKINLITELCFEFSSSINFQINLIKAKGTPNLRINICCQRFLMCDECLSFDQWFHFRQGSLIVQYIVILPSLNTTETTLAELDKHLENAAVNWTSYNQTVVGIIDTTGTKRAFKSESWSDCTFRLNAGEYCFE